VACVIQCGSKKTQYIADTWRSSHGLAVKTLNFHPANLGSGPAFTRMSCLWHQQGHPKFLLYTIKVCFTHGHVQGFVMQECTMLKVLLYL